MRIDGWQGEFWSVRWWARAFTFAAVLGVVLGIVGPFGSYFNGATLIRVLYWVGILLTGAVFAGLLVPWLTRAGLRIGMPWWFALAVAVLVTAVPTGADSWVIGHWLWSWQVARVTVADWYSQTVMVLAGIVGLWMVLELAASSLRGERHAPAAGLAASPAAAPTGPVLCLQMEDHYVRLHRRTGSNLELMTLQEAIERYGRAAGLQVHRSWWIAADAVEAAERDGRNWRLRLSNGLRVPVARNRIVEARARGWIAEEPR